MAKPSKKKTIKKSQVTKPQLFLSRPRDKSLEAYKEWINGMVQALGGKAGTMTEAEWRKAWKEFWENGRARP